MDKWGSARYNTAAQFVALVSSKNSSADYTSWVKGQMDYIFVGVSTLWSPTGLSGRPRPSVKHL